MEKFEIKWEAPEFRYYQKSIIWYWISIILASAVLALAVWEGNFLFGLLVVIAEVLILFWANNKPPMIKFKINEKGLTFGNKFFPYHEILHFSLNDEVVDGFGEIRIDFKNHIHPGYMALIPEKDIGLVRDKLRLFIREIAYEVKLSDAFYDFFKF